MIQLNAADRARFELPGDLPRRWEERAYAEHCTERNYWVNVGVLKFFFDSIGDAWAVYSEEVANGRAASIYRRETHTDFGTLIEAAH
ncbi:hypothetical protein [Streptomyces sp. 039-1]|uniref:hypothetical protein n=1 Tax=Streptomyces sp. 039-1 TaxID=2789263 RepID=UPI0039F4FC83